MKFKQTALAKARSGEIVGMTWARGSWHVVMRYASKGGADYEKCQYAVALRHTKIIDHLLNLPTLRIQRRIVAIMAVMWLVNQLDQVYSNDNQALDINWRQLVRELAGDEEAAEKEVVMLDATHVQRVYREAQHEV